MYDVVLMLKSETLQNDDITLHHYASTIIRFLNEKKYKYEKFKGIAILIC